MAEELPSKLEGKMAVEVTGTLLGTISSVEPRIREGKIIFKVDVEPVGEFRRRPTYMGRKTYHLSPEDILSVGKDCVIIGWGKVPQLSRIEELIQIAQKYESLVKDLESLRKDYFEKVEETKRLAQELELAKERVSRLSRMEEEYESLKETVIEQEGKLKIARDYVGVMEELENMIRGLRDDIKDMEQLEKIVRQVVNEELDSRGLRKTY